ncbi:MAG: hypothetical protein ACI4QI_01410, partial [Candidatus Coproplasma sp.]
AYLSGFIGNKDAAWKRLKTYADSGFKPSTTTGKQPKYTVASSYSSTTQLVCDIGDDEKRSVSFANGNYVSGTITLPDGKQYTSDSLKPAWAALESKLGLDVVDNFSVKSNKVTTAINNTTDSGKLSARDIITDGAKTINDNAELFLDLSNYLDEMPNYAKFLEENPIVRLSLTSDTETGAMYVAPYFDGYDDIEKYDLFKTNWVIALLDNTTGGDTTTTYKSHIETKNAANKTSLDATHASISAYIGQTGHWSVDILDKDGKKVEDGITVNYDKALAAATNETTPLGAAIAAAAGRVYDGDSGNIVDFMNFAINLSEGEVTGAKLLSMLQEYIKVAYYKTGTDTPFYTQAGYKLSDVFAGNSAAWDVDLYAALGRCLVTNPSLLKSGSSGNTIGGANATPLSNLYLVAARQSNMQRVVDITGFVGELYGIRGIEGYNIYTYIDANGDVQDVRGDYESYNAFNEFSKFYAEGLVFTGGASSDGQVSFYVENSVEVLSYHDYVNTQTPAGFQLEGVVSGTYSIENDYYLTPIISPVSKWNTSSSYDPTTYEPTDTEIMRMINSWRSVKDTGFAVPVDAVKNNPEKLKAVLSFIDYLFSDDGQITMTYGPKADDANSTNGFWYNREATADEIAKGQYFEYEGKKLYSETTYGDGIYVPTVTDKVKQLYYGNEVNGIKVDGKMTGDNAFTTSCARSYTNFARYVIGSALPIGNKLQSFEYQMTSEMGKSGAQVVATALDTGVIRHPSVTLTNQYDNPWYTLVPTVLPYTEDEKTLNTQAIMVSETGQDRYFTNNKNNTTNLYIEIIKNGFDASSYDAMFDSLTLTKN